MNTLVLDSFSRSRIEKASGDQETDPEEWLLDPYSTKCKRFQSTNISWVISDSKHNGEYPPCLE